MADRDIEKNPEVGVLGFALLILSVLFGGFAWYFESLVLVVFAMLMVFAAVAVVFFSRSRVRRDSGAQEASQRSPAQGSFVELGVNPETQKTSGLSVRASGQETRQQAGLTAGLMGGGLSTPESSPQAGPVTEGGSLTARERRRAAFVQDPEFAIHETEQRLGSVLQRARVKLERINPIFSKRLHKNTSTDVDSMLRINQIVTALEERLIAVQELRKSVLHLEEGQSLDLSDAVDVLYGDLQLPQDSLHSVSTDGQIEGVALDGIEEELGTLFSRLSRKRTFFKALRLDDEF